MCNIWRSVKKVCAVVRLIFYNIGCTACVVIHIFKLCNFFSLYVSVAILGYVMCFKFVHSAFLTVCLLINGYIYISILIGCCCVETGAYRCAHVSVIRRPYGGDPSSYHKGLRFILFCCIIFEFYIESTLFSLLF